MNVTTHSTRFALMLTLGGFGALSPWAAQANMMQEFQGQGLLNLAASTSEEVLNDQVRLNWLVQFERPAAADAVSEANKVLASAIAKLEKNPALKNLKNNIQSYPQYNKDGQPRSWVAQGTLSFEMPLESLKARGSVELDPPLALNNIQHFVGPAKTEAARDKLAKLAIAEFQAKAQSAAQAFGYKGYAINQVNLQDERGFTPPMPVMARAMKASAMDMASGTEVAAAGGTSNVQVSVSGSVCLKK